MTTKEQMEEDSIKARNFADNEVARLSSNDMKTEEKSTEDAQAKYSIQELMAEYNVLPDDFQTLCNKDPEIIKAIGGGKSCENLANAADKVRTKYNRGIAVTGYCLPGVRNIYNKCQNDSLSCQPAQTAIVASRLPYQKTNGGGNGYVALEASGNYVVFAIENKAYGKQRRGPEEQAMNDMVQQVQPGITLTVDSIENTQMRIKTGNTNGGKYGHIAVKRHDGNWGCDFNQKSINFTRYGKYTRICVPKDAYVSEEYAQKLIETAKERQQKNSQVLQRAIASKESIYE